MSDVAACLRRWYKAHKIAEENPELLLSAKTGPEATRISDLCAERMNEVGQADEAMFNLKAKEVPPLVNLFAKADVDRGCSHCWLSSHAVKDHPECEEKIRRWFAYKASLMTFVYEMYIARTEFDK